MTNQSAATPSTGSTANVQNDTYTYTPGGEVTKTTDTVAGQQQCYTYDPLDRLTARDQDGQCMHRRLHRSDPLQRGLCLRRRR